MELKYLLMLTSLKTLIAENLVSLVGPLGGQGDAEWQLPVEHINIKRINGNSGKELIQLLPHIPSRFKFEIMKCKNIKKLVVGTEGDEITAAEEKDDVVLLFPAHFFDSQRELEFYA
jgi:hypothetical protein